MQIDAVTHDATAPRESHTNQREVRSMNEESNREKRHEISHQSTSKSIGLLECHRRNNSTEGFLKGAA